MNGKVMHLGITSDANSESGVGEIVDEISGPTRRNFVSKNYGVGLLGVAVVLMCRDPKLNFRRRVRFARKQKMVFMDIMLDLDQMRHAEHERRKRIVVERLAQEIPEVLSKYSIRDFDEARLEKDLKGWLTDIGAASGASHKKAEGSGQHGERGR
jgi:hypothetical protein